MHGRQHSAGKTCSGSVRVNACRGHAHLSFDAIVKVCVPVGMRQCFDDREVTSMRTNPAVLRGIGCCDHRVSLSNAAGIAALRIGVNAR